jgi:Tfp pilus assembly protein PilX
MLQKIPVISQKGQTLLIVILIMVIMLSIALSVSARIVTTIKTVGDSQLSQRAFYAAEAGIEQASNYGMTASSGLPDGSQRMNVDSQSSYTLSITQLGGAAPNNALVLNSGQTASMNHGVDIQLESYDSHSGQYTGTLQIYWGSSNATTPCNTPGMAALETVLLSGTGTTVTSNHATYDPCTARRGAGTLGTNHTLAPTSTGSFTIKGVQFGYMASITVTNGRLLRIIPLYQDTLIAVQAAGANPTLPIQGQYIVATGTAGTGTGTVTRKITVTRTWPKVPDEVFPFSLYVPKDL